jgi:hypothetical protein
MTEPRFKPSERPGWPRWLNEKLAAAYLGVGVTLFLQEAAAGKWPRAERRGAKGGLLTWDRHLLDHASDELSNPSRIEKERMMEAVRRREDR